MSEASHIRPFVMVSLALHALAVLVSATLAPPRLVPPAPRLVEVSVLTKPRTSAREVTAQRTPATPKRAAARPSFPSPPARRLPTPPRAAAPARREGAQAPALRTSAKKEGAPGPRPVRMARRELPETPFLGLRPGLPAPGSGTPAGPGRNPRDETPGGNPGGGTSFSKVRPGISFPNEQLAEEPKLPGGQGAAVPEPLPRGLPIGRREAGAPEDAGLVARRVGGGSPAMGRGEDPAGGPRSDREPETVFAHGGAGGTHLPKATPRLGGGGGEYVIATGPNDRRDVDTVPAVSVPSRGPGLGGGLGAGVGGGAGVG
ncbi:MAG: hypothetical protein QHJ73_10695, partial [Armatimonadota bacterium]|nr:hypothetical protein [Armatimonadota bacterium]